MGKLFARVTFIPTLLLNVVLEKVTSRRWYDAIDERIILGALPFRSMKMKLVESENIRGVVSLNETYELEWLAVTEREWSEEGVKFLQLSTTDIFEAPSQDKLEEGVRFIRSFIEENNGNVYVHCKAGRTRSVTLVACYLMEKYGWDPTKSINFIEFKRPHIWLGAKQYQAIDDYYEKLNSFDKS